MSTFGQSEISMSALCPRVRIRTTADPSIVRGTRSLNAIWFPLRKKVGLDKSWLEACGLRHGGANGFQKLRFTAREFAKRTRVEADLEKVQQVMARIE